MFIVTKSVRIKKNSDKIYFIINAILFRNKKYFKLFSNYSIFYFMNNKSKKLLRKVFNLGCCIEWDYASFTLWVWWV